MISPVLNIGSSTSNYRKLKQPFIDSEIFAPLVDRKIEVIHSDIKNDDGVDMVGNLLDNDFRLAIKVRRPKAVICSNLMEHVQELDEFWNGVLELVEDHGLLIITIPFRYPKHMDPIDTLYRPSPEEIILRCSPCVVIEQKVINVGRPISTFLKNPTTLLVALIRVLMPFYNYAGWLTCYSKLKFSFRMRKISCVAVRIGVK